MRRLDKIGSLEQLVLFEHYRESPTVDVLPQKQLDYLKHTSHCEYKCLCENKHRMLSHDICDTHQQATVPLRVLLSALSLFSLRHCLTFIDPLHHKLNQQKNKTIAIYT